SKSYAMTGWRIGYGVMNKSLAPHIARLMTNSNSCTASFTQRAAIEAISGDQSEVDKMVKEFKKRRDVIVKGLCDIPKISCLSPKGAFYVFPNVKKIGWDTKKLADAILNEAGVAVLSGTAFGRFGEGYLRLSYANSVENISKALDRIRKFLAKL
ncbi:MAG TPA: aminotransferase class I/II-fold pyridoxal phosphate-dependent enzyme, partial [Terriglobales bacterium]|nr:aminotransferase class I/II-fold pyridoxal phosphate-dependent enzyme [Terriglobales bacterium]